jgi:hypothetical protein
MKSLLLITLFAFSLGCSKLDDDTLRDQGTQIGASISDDQMTRLKRFGANRYAHGRLDGRRRALKIGTVECFSDEDSKKPEAKYDLLVEDMLECLLKDSTATYFTCAKEFIQERLAEFKASNPVGEYPTCGHDYADIKWTPGFDPEDDPYYDEEGHDLSSVLRIIIGMHKPPPPEIQAILAAVGLLGRMGVLCPLEIDGCPDDPTDPGTWQEPAPPDHGGDR